MTVLIAVVALLVLLAIEMPVALALAASGALGLVILHNAGFAGAVLGGAPFSSLFSFSLTIVPMFILIGIFAVHGKIAEQVFAISSHVFRRLPGGLGSATVMACAGFAAVSGSSVATTATMARLGIDQMIRYGYPPSFAAGIVAASGTLGVMIPPSIILVLYSIMTGESTGKMLAAGIVPGVLSAASYIIYIIAVGRRLPVSAGAPSTPGKEAPPRDETLRSLPWRGLVRVVFIFAIIMGGIYSGFFTPTESGALGAVAALLMMLLELRRERPAVRWRAFSAALKESAQTTSMVFAIVIGSAIFSNFLISSGAPRDLTNWLVHLDAPPAVIVLLLLLVMIPLGMALEGISILVITMPLMYPIVTELGYDGVWFGIMATKMIELGLITPPVGITCFVVAGNSRSVTVEQAFAGIWPFVVLDLAALAFFFAFPEVVLWLPNLVR